MLETASGSRAVQAAAPVAPLQPLLAHPQAVPRPADAARVDGAAAGAGAGAPLGAASAAAAGADGGGGWRRLAALARVGGVARSRRRALRARLEPRLMSGAAPRGRPAAPLCAAVIITDTHTALSPAPPVILPPSVRSASPPCLGIPTSPTWVLLCHLLPLLASWRARGAPAVSQCPRGPGSPLSRMPTRVARPSLPYLRLRTVCASLRLGCRRLRSRRFVMCVASVPVRHRWLSAAVRV